MGSRQRIGILIFSVLLFGGALLATRSIFAFIVSKMPWEIRNQLAVQRRMKKVAEAMTTQRPRSEHIVAVFGDSSIVRGFIPVVFDEEVRLRHGMRVRAYNYASHGGGPEISLAASRRFCEDLNSKGLRAAESVVQWHPIWLSPEVGSYDWVSHYDYVISMLASPGMLVDYALEDPARGFELFFLRAVGHHPSTIRTSLMLWRRYDKLHSLGEIASLFRRKTGREHPGYGWSEEERGYVRIVFDDKSERLYRKSMSDADKEIDSQVREFSARYDCFRLSRIDVERQNAFVRIVRTLGSCSDSVVLLAPPFSHPRAPWTDAGKRRAEELLADLARRVGVASYSFMFDDDFGGEDYFDLFHLNDVGGAEKLSRRMASALGGRIASSKGGSGPVSRAGQE